jgi:hypothetical protein
MHRFHKIAGCGLAIGLFRLPQISAQAQTAATPAIEVSTIKRSDYPGRLIGLPGPTLTTRAPR